MANDGLTVAVTGPTGDLGMSILSALERSRRVSKVVGMARRPFDPKDAGLRKTEYRQGDVTDKKSVRDALKGADVVVHLAFAILTASERTHAVNIEGSRNVFEAAVEAGAERICYASSVAAYGFHQDNPDWLTEDIPPRGTPEHFYSAQKAEVEAVLGQVLLRSDRTRAWVFRPCVVAGPRAQTLVEEIPYYKFSDALPDSVRRFLGGMPILKPVIPDVGPRFQLVHHDDVASAFLAGVLGKGAPGPYNLAGRGTVEMADVADALGWYTVPLPDLAIDATAELVARLPRVPPQLAWVHSVRKPVLMKIDRARKELGWEPKYTAKQTLKETVEAFRAEEKVGAN
jgi:UDP-glucose 4-epimerase